MAREFNCWCCLEKFGGLDLRFQNLRSLRTIPLIGSLQPLTLRSSNTIFFNGRNRWLISQKVKCSVLTGRQRAIPKEREGGYGSRGECVSQCQW